MNELFLHYFKLFFERTDTKKGSFDNVEKEIL